MPSLPVPTSVACVCSALLSTMLVSAAHAALIEVDWRTAGDNQMVRDTDTRLEWLNLTRTLGQSHAYVTAQTGTGGMFDGLRYATNDEVVALFGTHFGIDLSAGRLREAFAYLDPGARIASETLGDGISGGTDEWSGPNANYRLVGLTGEFMQNGSPFVLGAATRWSDTDYYTVKDPLSYGEVYPGEQPWVGSYLVRVTEVPLPAAVWLFGAGLLALTGVRRMR